MEKINYKELLIYWSTREDGTLMKKYTNVEELNKNKNKFYKKLGFSRTKTRFLNVLNEDKIKIIKKKPVNRDIKADAIITKLKDIYFYLGFADCIPFVAYDEVNEVLAFAHLGWRSIYIDLHDKIIKKMIETYNSNPKDIKVFLGPSITKESYTFKDSIQAKSDKWKNYIELKNDIYHVDLHSYVIDNIKKLNIQNINKSDINTYENENYYSHHRSTKDKNYIPGRFIFGAGMLQKKD